MLSICSYFRTLQHCLLVNTIEIKHEILPKPKMQSNALLDHTEKAIEKYIPLKFFPNSQGSKLKSFLFFKQIIRIKDGKWDTGGQVVSI